MAYALIYALLAVFLALGVLLVCKVAARRRKQAERRILESITK